ncbi:MAG: cyclophane-forming radical SAM/SPASM peptide maturase GrrM/OscB [Burkholderiaceae bacterium]
MPTPKVSLLVVQATPFCNIECKYCYLPDRRSKKKLDSETCAKIFRRIFESGWYGDELTVVWHAGEPMVVSPRVYEEFFEQIDLLTPGGLEICHSFQTNGTLIDDSWCDLISRRNIRIGVSIDGPKAIHDSNRLDRLGRGTFDLVRRGIEKLKSRNIRFSTISVLTRAALQNPTGMFDFFRELDPVAVCFNIEEIEGLNATSTLASDGVYEECNAFFRKFWHLMSKNCVKFSVREFEDAIGSVVRPDDAPVFNTQSEPFSILSVDCDGNFSTFSPEFIGLRHEKYGDFSFGRLGDVTLESGLGHPIFLGLSEDIKSGVEACRTTCPYFSVCGGGAPINKLAENGSLNSTETMFCKLTKMLLTDIAVDFLDSEATGM